MNEQLKTFIQVAESGSFSKAAEKLFISSTAVMKQMNLLEKQAGVPLFIRTNHGVRLTEAGTAFNKDAAFMLQYFQEALIRMRQAAQANRLIIRVGTSILNPCKVLIDLWNGVSDQYPNFKINIVYFEDDAHTLPTTYRTIGRQFDFIVGPFLTDNWKDYFRVLELGSYRFCFAVSRNHRLASKKTLTVKDLYGERLVVVNGGKSAVINDIRDFLIRNHPQIRIKDVPRLYELDVFNRCEESNTVMLTLEAWTDIHPSLVTIPSDLDFAIPYGLLYPLHPSEEVNQFLEIIIEMQCMHKNVKFNQ
ncbi:LysR family transcriptional regulator [Paenibacillus sp. Soil724D2]|uniref:LysR family transcriptional regulator n=1 Tax=Paenibacillus sp. (strain Soil724D2) TaxID=1736392 RepID=UPI000714547B|nr:LysR family transcriptional regulator [Paenibacillus sp. Soil724D2]KRE46397.1 LysR family transcriptional regulator [Paenibacillus sp. Soil724D2]